ncbi:TPA: hypothetical protein ENS27_16650 [bacterium]|nr:hypothetical protein [bacterium]
MKQKDAQKIVIFIILCFIVCDVNFLKANDFYSYKSSLYIDLNKLPVYVHPGFSKNLASNVPDANDSAWKIFQPSNNNSRVVRFLEIDEIPKPRFFSLKVYKPIEYTFLIMFNIQNKNTISTVPGLHLASIGDNWEIYLNGKLLKSEVHLTKDGEIASHRSYRDVYMPLDSSWLVPGLNILAFRIIGEPTNTPVGFSFAHPYVITDYETIRNYNNNIWNFGFCVVYIFIGFYYLVLYLFRRRDRYNLFYGLFSIDLGLYFFVRLNTVYQLIADSFLIMKIEFISLYMVMPLISTFIEVLSINKTRWGTRIIVIFCSILSLATIFVPSPFAHDLLKIWQYSALFMMLYIFGYAVLWDFFSTAYRRWKRNAVTQNRTSLGKQLLHDLLKTSLGNVVIGALILFCTAVVDIFNAIFSFKDLLLSRYGLFLFTSISALVLANRYNFLFKQLNYANDNLEKRINDLMSAKLRAEKNEIKYRSLFTGTNDPIALLDKDFCILECNGAALNYFNLDEIDFSSSQEEKAKLTDILYADQREQFSLEERFSEARDRLLHSKQPVEVQAQIRSPIGEFKSCILRMESIRSSKEIEILLRVIPSKIDELTKGFIEGREHYVIENTLTAADEITQHVSKNLTKYISAEDANFLKVCIREIVINAIEHGNLEITFDEKSRAQRERRYFEFLQERKENPKYKERRVNVEYSITKERAVFRITDQGKGFDHKKFLKKMADPSPDLLEHGRGLFMTLSAFDRVVYNTKGNQVVLEKHFSK